MHSLLAKYLEKLGYKSLEEISDKPMPDGSPSEKQTFDNWQRILSSKQEITVDNITEFCQSQLNQIDGQMKNLDNTARKNERLVMLHGVYKSLLEATKSNQREREQLEAYLNSLLT